MSLHPWMNSLERRNIYSMLQTPCTVKNVPRSQSRQLSKIHCLWVGRPTVASSGGIYVDKHGSVGDNTHVG